MKATLSIAVMALLGHVSAVELAAMRAPAADALLQTQSHHHHHRVKSAEKKKKHRQDEIHGYMAPSDDNTSYDPDVADAPEDIKRVGNDHEEYHNAKLSPEGYYDGFFHKDYQGNYAQKRHGRHHKVHHQKTHHGKHPRYIQLNDHKKDTDDVVEDDDDFVQHRFDHENDSDDVVEEFSDVNNVQSNYEHENDPDDVVDEFSDMGGEAPTARGSAIERINNFMAQEKYYAFAQHDMVNSDLETENNLQLAYEHENDVDDIPETNDPMELNLSKKHKRGEPYLTNQEFMEQRQDIKNQHDADEVEDIQKDQLKEDWNNAVHDHQLQQKAKKSQVDDEAFVQIAYDRIPHENDTDDVSLDNLDFQYNHKHSKAWNEEVNQRAEEIENEMKIEENMRLSQKKAQADAKIKAQKEKIRLAEEKRKKLEEEQRQKALGDGPNKKTVDFGELYKGIEMVQLDADYQRHSKFMQHELDQAEKEQERKDYDDAENELYGLYKSKAEREADKAEIEKTIDHAELYDNITLQTEEKSPYEKHHQDWDEQVEQETNKLEKQMAEVEREQQEETHHRTIDMGDLYENINVQLKNRQKHHTDEFNDRVEAYEQALEKEAKDDELQEKKIREEEQARRVMAQGMTPDSLPVEMKHPNPSINIAEMYGGIEDSFLQVNFEHEHDNDDIVPELTENVIIEKKMKVADTRKTDFNGEKYEEFYDE